MSGQVYIYPPLSVTVNTGGLATAANQVAEIALLTTIDADTSNISSEISLLEDRLAGSLVPEAFDYQSLTYVPSGNGVGEIQTVVFKSGGSGGTTVATLTLTYDANNKLSTVTKS